jgi:hypothetical protein
MRLHLPRTLHSARSDHEVEGPENLEFRVLFGRGDGVDLYNETGEGRMQS